MENIFELDENYNFNNINLENPIPIQGGSFFSKINFSSKNLPMYLQLPKCKSKSSINKLSLSNKMYLDLLFEYNNNNLIISWFEKLQDKCIELIYKNKDTWFQSELNMDDIENMFLGPLKSYKSAKYINLRVFIPNNKNIKKEYCLVYDENEKPLDIKDINETLELIPLIYIEGIKFSSKCFQLEINLPQIMVLTIRNDIKNKCMINNFDKSKNNKSINFSNNTEEIQIDDNELSEEKQVNSCTNDENIQNKKNLENEQNLEKSKQSKNNNLDNCLEEIDDLELTNNNDYLELKEPFEVYNEIYKKALNKAKELKRATLEAYLEAKDIKSKYFLKDIENSENEDSDLENLLQI